MAADADPYRCAASSAQADGSPGQPHGRRGHRRWAGFVVSGSLAFLVDSAILEAGVRLLGLPPIAVRPFGILAAMVVGWLAHRRLTFDVAEPPSLAEFMRYAGAAFTSAFMNYALFALALYMKPTILPLVALILSSAVAMIFAYLAMRYAVFRETP